MRLQRRRPAGGSSEQRVGPFPAVKTPGAGAPFPPSHLFSLPVSSQTSAASVFNPQGPHVGWLVGPLSVSGPHARWGLGTPVCTVCLPLTLTSLPAADSCVLALGWSSFSEQKFKQVQLFLFRITNNFWFNWIYFYLFSHKPLEYFLTL